ncbi:MAG: fatty acid desaturase [Myxococcota bacterium]|jgi:fatty acid desaturase
MPRQSTLAIATLGQPSVLFRRTRWFYFLYDCAWLALLTAGISTALLLGWTGFDVGWGWHLVPLLALATYGQIIGSGTIHNAAHANWPRPFNRLIGELAGAVVMTRFASWEILHKAHHKYSDVEGRDPHHVIEGGFWRFFRVMMLVNLELNVRAQFLERWGNDAAMVRFDKFRTAVSAVTMVALAAGWYVLLGPVLFFAVFVPAAVMGGIHIGHFNWITHRGNHANGDYHPVNLDHGLYWLGNRVCFGLYYHENHHHNPNLINPRNYVAAEIKELPVDTDLAA